MHVGFVLFGTWIEVFGFVGVEHISEADIAQVGADTSTVTREGVVGVGTGGVPPLVAGGAYIPDSELWSSVLE